MGGPRKPPVVCVLCSTWPNLAIWRLLRLFVLCCGAAVAGLALNSSSSFGPWTSQCPQKAIGTHRTAESAASHVARPLDLRLRYMTNLGLANQVLAHLTGLMIAQEVGAAAVLHPAWARTVFKFGSEASWRIVPIDTLLDVESMVALWAQRNLTIYRVGAATAASAPACLRCPPAPALVIVTLGTCPCLQPPPIDPELAANYSADLPRTGPPSRLPPSRLYGHGGECHAIPLPEPGPNLHAIAVHARRNAVAAAEAYRQANGTLPACINLDTPNTLLRIRLDQ